MNLDCEFDRLSVRCLSFFFFKQKTAYEMRISDWSSDVCSSDLMLNLSCETHCTMPEISSKLSIDRNMSTGLNSVVAQSCRRESGAQASHMMIVLGGCDEEEPTGL